MYDHIIMQLQLSLEALKYLHADADYSYNEETGTIEGYSRMKSVESSIVNLTHALEYLREAQS